MKAWQPQALATGPLQTSCGVNMPTYMNPPAFGKNVLGFVCAYNVILNPLIDHVQTQGFIDRIVRSIVVPAHQHRSPETGLPFFLQPFTEI